MLGPQDHDREYTRYMNGGLDPQNLTYDVPAKSPDPECCHHLHTVVCSHNGFTIQRMTHGHMGIIGHDSEEGKLCAIKSIKREICVTHLWKEME